VFCIRSGLVWGLVIEVGGNGSGWSLFLLRRCCNLGVEAPVVEPFEVHQGVQFDVVGIAPRALTFDWFVFVKPVERLGETLCELILVNWVNSSLHRNTALLDQP